MDYSHRCIYLANSPVMEYSYLRLASLPGGCRQFRQWQQCRQFLRSPGINSVIFYYGSYLIDELGNGDANGIYDSYGHKNTGVKS